MASRICSALSSVAALLALPCCGRLAADVLVEQDERACSGKNCAGVAWPNEESRANSDRWLVEHHDAITVMRPRVLVLQFLNVGTSEMWRDHAERVLADLRESTRYHAYADPRATPFVDYRLFDLVELRDASQFVTSGLLPRTQGGDVDWPRLFSPEYKGTLGLADPWDVPETLSLCELFERGLVHELWVFAEPTRPAIQSFGERRQAYDASGEAIPGVFTATPGFENVACGVTVRAGIVDVGLEPECAMLARDSLFERTYAAQPYLAENAAPFLNFGMRERHGTPFDNWFELCGNVQRPCIDYPTPSSVEGTLPDGSEFAIDPFVQGCGSTLFAPNSRFALDFDNPEPVRARCEHFGRPGDEPFGVELLGSGAARSGTCGGSWQIYRNQSIPGHESGARDTLGGPMKNWWPFRFY